MLYARELLRFWFSPTVEPYWFSASPTLDEEITERFHEFYESAIHGGLAHWEENAETMLALVILFDQFPRNMFRNEARAFATDDQAKRLSAHAITRKMDQQLSPTQRRFLYMPFMHSEKLEDQVKSVALFETLGEPTSIDFARQHHSIIARFGRFPHRNAALSRISTPLEEEFLQMPGSSF